MKKLWIALLCAACALGTVAGCGDNDDTGNNGTPANNDTGNNDQNNDQNNDTGNNDAPNNDDNNGVNNDPLDPARFDQPGCDPISPDFCALPWPSNVYLKADPERATGFRLEFEGNSLPANTSGVHMDPDGFAGYDGYGVGSAIVAYFPNVDVSELTAEEDIVSSLDPASKTVLLEVTQDGTQRVPHWAEVDLQESDEAMRGFIIRPAVILKESTRYIVAMRGLNDTSGQPIAPSDAFAALRDGNAATYNALAPREEHFENIFTTLEDNGVPRDDLTLAWDFVTASSQALHGPALTMREDGLEALDAEGYEVVIDELNEFSEEQNAEIAFEVVGRYRVPHFMREVPVSDLMGWRFNTDDQGNIVQNDWVMAPFIARIPRSAIDGEPAGVVLYGHGLNGSMDQVRGGFNRAVGQRHNLIFVATDMWGMSTEDVPAILRLITDMGLFPALSERLVQGLFNHVALVRAARDHMASLPEFQERGVTIDTERVYYSGISQGGIFGASFIALSPDITLGHLGVPGQNYSTLLHRSVDFEPFLIPLEVFYPNSIDRLLVLGAVGTLWERADPVSYYRHISAEPFADTPPGAVLLASATGDYQVALVTNEITARSGLDVALMTDYGKEVPGIEPTAYPHTGSGVVNYTFGNPWPPVGNLPPSDDVGDPHGKPRNLRNHQDQMVHFWESGGEIIDVCGGDACTPE